MRKRHFSTNPDKIIHPVSFRASRALVAGPHGELPRVALQFTDAENKVYEYDLEVKDLVALIEAATAAYQAIVPPLRTSRVGWGG